MLLQGKTTRPFFLKCKDYEEIIVCFMDVDGFGGGGCWADGEWGAD